MDNNSSNKNNSNKPNNKVNMPKFNLNWMYMIIALMLLGLWWGSDSRGAGNKAVTNALISLIPSAARLSSTCESGLGVILSIMLHGYETEVLR